MVLEAGSWEQGFPPQTIWTTAEGGGAGRVVVLTGRPRPLLSLPPLPVTAVHLGSLQKPLKPERFSHFLHLISTSVTQKRGFPGFYPPTIQFNLSFSSADVRAVPGNRPSGRGDHRRPPSPTGQVQTPRPRPPGGSAECPLHPVTPCGSTGWQRQHHLGACKKCHVSRSPQTC